MARFVLLVIDYLISISQIAPVTALALTYLFSGIKLLVALGYGIRHLFCLSSQLEWMETFENIFQRKQLEFV
jgi:hypothetical protein